MATLIETMADVNFRMFLLGSFGIYFFMWIHKLLSKCNSFVFSTVCVVLTYLIFAHMA